MNDKDITMSGRGVKVAEAIRKEIADLLLHGEIKDPRIDSITVTRVVVHDDLKNALIYISVLGSEEKKKNR